jgi:hypothetical protein
MTPTEQDKELRKAICRAMHIYPEELQYRLPNSFGESELEAIMQLITADRKRVALEARLDELTRVLQQPYISQQVYGQDRIAELKAQQEEV